MKTPVTTFLLLLTLCSLGLADPKTDNDYSKQILGRWLGRRKFEIYYPDGTWAVQRNEDSKPDKAGCRWHIDGHKLTLIYPGGTTTETIVSEPFQVRHQGRRLRGHPYPRRQVNSPRLTRRCG